MVNTTTVHVTRVSKLQYSNIPYSSTYGTPVDGIPYLYSSKLPVHYEWDKTGIKTVDANLTVISTHAENLKSKHASYVGPQ
jgi:hypothetical protein